MVWCLSLIGVLAVAMAASEESWNGTALQNPANSTQPVTERTPIACNRPWDGENWTNNSFKVYRKVCNQKQLCFNRTRATTKRECRTLKALGFSYRYCETKILVVREPYCIEHKVCERRASIAGSGQSMLQPNEEGTISHANGSGKSDQYENNTEHIWNIRATKPCQNIHLYIDTLNIESSTDCVKDYLLIQDSPCAQTHRLCGSISGVTYRSTTGQLQIKFSSDSETTDRGFRGVYWFECGEEQYTQRPARSTRNSRTTHLRQLKRRAAWNPASHLKK